MHRRGVGIGALQAQQKTAQRFQHVGSKIAEDDKSHVDEQIRLFERNLQEFALKHKRRINQDPEFRTAFQTMCREIGVDPLVSNKGFWTRILGVGDFYYELAIQALDVCFVSRSRNGGLISLHELTERLRSKRQTVAHKTSTFESAKTQSHSIISQDDVLRAIESLSVLGGGISILTIGGKKMILSVPCEVTQDHSNILDIASRQGGCISVSDICEVLGWEVERAQRALNQLLEEGIAWRDDQEPKLSVDSTFWVFSIWRQSKTNAI